MADAPEQQLKDAKRDQRGRLRDFWRSIEHEGGVTKAETGIAGLDQLLEGGLPAGRATLISAGPGCGKTVLLNEFLYRGATEFDEPGIFVTFEERPAEIRRNLRNFGWDFEPLIKQGLLNFIDGSPNEDGEISLSDAEWLEPILAQIEMVMKRTEAKRLAVDNLGAVFLRYQSDVSPAKNREQLFRFADRIKALGLTTLISTERAESLASLSQYGVGEFVSDGLIELDIQTRPGVENRLMQVRKLRGCGYRTGSVRFEITSRGIAIYPKIPVDTSLGDTDFDDRDGFGLPLLDKAMGGGIPRGHIMLVTGNTGTGKSTLALHFVREGLAREQGVVWVALEEPIGQVLKTAASHHWDLQPAVDNGGLRFVTSSLLNVNPDKLLYQIIDAVEASRARRVIVDSVSSLESASMEKEQVREFMIQLVGYAKTRGITVVMNYLSGETFGAAGGQLLGSMMTNDMRLSSIVDGVLMLRYVERDQGVSKLLNILKLRGSRHVKDILRYEITEAGVQLGERFGVN